MNRYAYTYEIAVIGGGPAGLATAVTAARAGRKVVLVDKNGYLGGNLTLGLPLLGFLDEHGKTCIAGFAEEVASRLRARGAAYEHRVCPKHNSVSNINPDDMKLLAFEMCREAGVDVLLHLEAHDVTVENGRIRTVSLYGKCNAVTISADLFVDCTGDGDLAYLAGCHYDKGRDGSGELMPPTVMFTLQGVDDEKLFDYVAEHPDEMLPSCDLVDHRPGYDAAYFRANPNYVFVGMTQLFKKLRAEGKCPVERDNMIVINGLHKGEVYINTTRLLHVDGTDVLDLTRGEIEGHLQVRKLVETFRTYVPGFENCYVSSIAPSIGIRETRRFRGLRTVTGDEALDGCVPEDTICLSGYKIDIHKDCEGDTLFRTVDRPFGVPYGSLVSADLDNLMFAGRCASVDDQVVGSTRVMPCCMAMGQAAGIGAAYAIEDGILPSEVDVARVRAELLRQNAIL
ncbi:MAG: FAD-dependent oxidoreductase, partial [Clostridia bacterium]|nr:FAD-dependent oxidoreductase [Clostridia bacterium]